MELLDVGGVRTIAVHPLGVLLFSALLSAAAGHALAPVLSWKSERGKRRATGRGEREGGVANQPAPSLTDNGMNFPPAALPYGPNTAAVRRFLQHLAGKPASDCIAAARAYSALQQTREFAAADRALGVAIDRAERAEARDAVVGPIVQLMGSHEERVSGKPEAGVAPEALAESALAAALALIARDLVPATVFDVLYGPYAELIPTGKLEITSVER